LNRHQLIIALVFVSLSGTFSHFLKTLPMESGSIMSNSERFNCHFDNA
jgi:hypothetical protein